MKSKFGFLILLALAFQAQAATVSQRQAMGAARAWASSGRVLNTAVQPTVSAARTYAVTNGLVLHAVTMADGRTVFVSGDDALEPVVALTSGTPAEDSPLIDILRRDAYLRAVAAGYFSAPASQSPATPSTSLAAGAPPAHATVQTPEIRRKWAALLPKEKERTTTSDPTALTADNMVSEDAAPDIITDMRVEPLLDSRWSQTTTTGGLPCYNYYTPVCVDPRTGAEVNAPCGCTATAMSQILRYFRYPERLPWEFNRDGFPCTVDGEPEKLFPVGITYWEEGEDAWGRIGSQTPYDWDSMDGVPGAMAIERAREAIGHLTYDVGIVLKSDYTADETGASPDSVPAALKTFGYPSGYMFYNSDGVREYHDGGEIDEEASATSLTGDAELRQKTILASLDAKLPVLMGIYGFAKDVDGTKITMSTAWGGHAVVADGYGMTEVDGETTTYVHVNLGWGGEDDAWYNLPEIDTAAAGATVLDASGFDFELLSGATFNVTSDEDAAGKELVTGRVLDDDGEPVENATVEAFDANGDLVTSVTTDAKGIYALWLAGGNRQYDIEATSEDGSMMGVVEDPIRVTSTVAGSSGLVSRSQNVGNKWGVDIELSSPCVRIGDALFANLDRALAAAVDGDTVEIVLPARLKKSVTLDGIANLTIVATNEDAYASPVTCRKGASITISDGASVTFTNVVFSSSATVVKVLAGGKASVAGVAVFDDIFSGVFGIVTADDKGFNLAGELLNGLTLDCATATTVGATFGTYSCGTDTAKACANRIISTRGDDRAGAWHSELAPGVGFIKWEDDAEVAPEVARASLVVDAGEPTYYRSFDKLFLRNAATNGVADATLLLPSTALTNAWTLSGAADWTLHSTVEGGTLKFTKGGVALKIGSNATLTVSDIVLAGSDKLVYGSSPLTVLSGASLTFGAGAEAKDFPVAEKRHLVDVANRATFTMETGSAISGCTIAGKGTGTVFLAGGATFNFAGGTITGCSVNGDGKGAAVYVSNGATLNLSGDATAFGNVVGTSLNPNDVYLVAGANLVLAGPLAGSLGIGINGETTVLKDGATFGTVASGLTARETAVACSLLSNEKNTDLYADANGSDLVWTTVRPAPIPVENEWEGMARVSSGGETQYYATLADAFRAATTDGATITLTRDVDWDESVAVLANGVVLDGAGHELRRPDDPNDDTDGFALFAITNASLTVKNVTIVGGLGRVFDVYRGGLTFDSGAALTGLTGFTGEEHGIPACTKDYVAPIVVWGGTFTMNSGAAITRCINTYPNRGPGDPLAAGAVVVSGATEAPATAYLNGGEISDCECYSVLGAGGIYIGNEAKVEVKGVLLIKGNGVVPDLNSNDRLASNLVVQDLSALTLVGELTGAVGFTEGVDASTNEFGKATFSGDVQASAHRFTHDTNGDIGMAVGEGSPTLLVWGAALDEDGEYMAEDGAVYPLVDGDAAQIDLPAALEVVYDGTELTGVAEGAGYTITGNTGTNAVTYAATVVLRPGFAWSDGGDAERTITWEIQKADYVLGTILFWDEKHPYFEGTNWVHKGITSKIPECLRVEYANREREEVGTNEVTATITGVYTASGELDPNYNPFTTNVTAQLVVLPRRDNSSDPDAPTTNTPQPIAFKSITRLSETEWELVITNMTPKCEYRLLETDDLAAGFPDDAEWFRAADDAAEAWTTNVTADAAVRFWKAEARETVDPIEPGVGGEPDGGDSN